MPKKICGIIGLQVFVFLSFVCVDVPAVNKPEDKQGIFSGRIKGNIEAKKVGSNWRITVDEF